MDPTCGECGRAMPPDGDCYGCAADRYGRALAQIVQIESTKLHLGESRAELMARIAREALEG